MKYLQKLVLGGHYLHLPPASDQLQTLELFTMERVKVYANQPHFRFPRLARLCMPPQLFLKPDAAGLVSLTRLSFKTCPQYAANWVRGSEELSTTARPPPLVQPSNNQTACPDTPRGDWKLPNKQQQLSTGCSADCCGAAPNCILPSS